MTAPPSSSARADWPTPSPRPTGCSLRSETTHIPRKADDMTVIEKTRSHEVDVNRHDTEEEAGVLALGILLRGAEVGMAVLIGLLVCPPLAILVAVVAVPLLAVAIVVGLLVAIVAMPYLLVR